MCVEMKLVRSVEMKLGRSVVMKLGRYGYSFSPVSCKSEALLGEWFLLFSINQILSNLIHLQVTKANRRALIKFLNKSAIAI